MARRKRRSFDKLRTGGFGALWLAVALLGAAPLCAQEVTASEPSDLSVTIYRDPARSQGGALQLGALGGFAVITETRRVVLPAGRSRLRFVGVVDGIIPESAIVSGLPGGVIEKNRDAALLSPSALFRATQGRQVMLRRTLRGTGKTVMEPVKLISASPEGVIFQGATGQEALRCSGLRETFTYDLATNGLSARPVLSVATRTAKPVTAEVTLTYLAQNFDWSASYIAAVTPEGDKFDLGGWITLANGNSVSLPNAKVQIVAGGLKRELFRKLVDGTPRVYARCWVIRTTKDIPLKPDRPYELVKPYIPPRYEPVEEERDEGAEIIVTGSAMSDGYTRYREPAMAAPAPPPPPPPPVAEQLGDLKLYRLPERTTVAALQMKQSRLVEKEAVPFERVQRIWLDPLDPNVSEYMSEKVGQVWQYQNPVALIRTRNDKAHELGLPLPSGALLLEQDHFGLRMMIAQPRLRDLAIDEKVELELAPSPDITIARRTVKRGKRWQNQEVKLTNAGAEAVAFELRLRKWGTIEVSEADQPLDKEDGEPIFRLTLQPNSEMLLHYKVTWK